MSANRETGLRVAIDIGGTFVDAIAYDEKAGELLLHKAPTTPDDPARGVMDAISGLLSTSGRDNAKFSAFVHGTTLGLNAILQRRGARVGIIANEGFRDLLEIARAAIPPEHMYNFSYAPPPPLVARRDRIGVPGRIDARGNVVIDLDEEAVLAAGRLLVESHGITSLAVCFLHSYINPEHERRAGRILRDAFPQVAVAISSDITREYREYERTSTVALDAYIRPVLHSYLGALEAELTESSLLDGTDRQMHIMRSGGGAMTADVARQASLTTVLSGPAGGVAGASFLAQELAWPLVITLDMGGTSVDACVIEGGVPTDVHEATIDSFPVLIPIFDIRSVGAGGGSIAWVHDGLLKVGPRSAGAVPGPVAYGLGGAEPTVTDAAFVLGYLDPSGFLDGAMPIDAVAARQAISTRIAAPLGIEPEAAAASVFEVLLARTVSALREITVERGLDPREFSLLAFGGAGPLLGPMLAREMEIATTVIPRVPAAFSAFGMLLSDLRYEFSATVLRPLTDQDLSDLSTLLAELTDQGGEVLLAQGLKKEDHRFVRTMDVRYKGQEHTLAIEVTEGDTAADLTEQFHKLHRLRHGHAMPESCEILAARVLALGELNKPSLVRIGPGDGLPPTPVGRREAHDVASGLRVQFELYDRETLKPGHLIAGPAIVEEGTSTTVLFADQQLLVDDYGQLLVTTISADQKEATHDGP